MQHPFLNQSELEAKSLDELHTTIGDLTKKLTFAYRIQNGPMIHQLQMILESYKVEVNKRLDELYKKQGLKDKINISSQQE